MKRKKLPYWNHNTAYYPWIERQIGNRRRILDVGCGDGSLVYWLSDSHREIGGLEPSASCFCAAEIMCRGASGVRLLEGTFEDFPFGKPPEDELFDVVIFSASLHHMEQSAALRKAVSLLAEGGVLVVTGLAAPSSFSDYVLEALRVVPSFVLSRFHRMQSAESRGIPVSRALPSMEIVRKLVKKELPGASMRRGIHYRYLLRYEKKTV